jgi:hypothetical protein
MKLIAGKDFAKVYHSRGFKYRIKVRAALVHLDGNPKPYFSITGEIHYQAKNNRWVEVACGCIHDEILQHFPNLKPLVDIHLSDDQGVPMHAYANASYWAGFTKWQKRDIKKLAAHLRTSELHAPSMVEDVLKYMNETDEDIMTEEAWRDVCQDYGLIDQWKREASEAVSLLNIVQREEV